MGASVVLELAAGAAAAGFAVALAVALTLWRRARLREARIGALEQMATTDPLTGLPNRRAWEEQLPRELARAIRHHDPVCVAMLDLDRFKDFNDARGHLAGDRLLKQAAAAWRSALRPYDLLVRYGGEEFALVLPGCALAEARGIVERLRGATPDSVSCSAGIAEWDRHDHAEVLVSRADVALYEAKRLGRDRVACAPPSNAAH